MDRPPVNHIPHATREIPLTKGLVAVVDVDDAPLIAGYRWRALVSRTRRTPYAAAFVSAGGLRRTVLMHRLIMSTPSGQVVDHIDGDGLNNRRHNLRNCDHRQNMCNRRHQGGTSEYRGVRRHRGRWTSQINHCGVRIHLGVHSQEVEAAYAFDLAARELHAEYAKLNFPDRSPGLLKEDRLFFRAATGRDIAEVCRAASGTEPNTQDN